MERLKKDFPNPKFGLAGEQPRVVRTAATLDDLITELIEVRAAHGNLPVVRTAYVEYLDGLQSEVLNKGDTVFSVANGNQSVVDATKPWSYDGPVLEVRSDS